MFEFVADTDNDGRITILDVLLASQLASNHYTDEGALKRTDLDGSGSVSTDEVNAIIRHLKGEIILNSMIF